MDSAAMAAAAAALRAHRDLAVRVEENNENVPPPRSSSPLLLPPPFKMARINEETTNDGSSSSSSPQTQPPQPALSFPATFNYMMAPSMMMPPPHQPHPQPPPIPAPAFPMFDFNNVANVIGFSLIASTAQVQMAMLSSMFPHPSSGAHSLQSAVPPPSHHHHHHHHLTPIPHPLVPLQLAPPLPQHFLPPQHEPKSLSTTMNSSIDSGLGSPPTASQACSSEESEEDSDGGEVVADSPDVYFKQPLPSRPPPIQTAGNEYIPAPSNHKHVFAKVAGRLKLLNDAHKYEMTVGELHRRINAPECLNASIIGAIMRRAKAREGGKELQHLLRSHQITLVQGRRKNVPNTAFTCLLEEEARQMATDLGKLYERDFRAQELAQEKARRLLQAGANAQDLLQNTLHAMKSLDDWSAFLLQCQMEYGAEPELALPAVRHFSLMTHEFGWPAHCAMLKAQRQMLAHEYDVYASLVQQQQQQQQHNDTTSASAAAAAVASSSVGAAPVSWPHQSGAGFLPLFQNGVNSRTQQPASSEPN